MPADKLPTQEDCMETTYVINKGRKKMKDPFEEIYLECFKITEIAKNEKIDPGSPIGQFIETVKVACMRYRAHRASDAAKKRWE